MNNGRKTIIKVQAILFAVLFAAFAFAGCKNNDNNKADENGFTAEQRTVLCDAARAFYLLDFDYNSKDNAISFRQLEEFAFYIYQFGGVVRSAFVIDPTADNSGYRSVDGQKVDDIVKMLFGVKLGTRSSRPSTKLNFYYRDGKYYFMVGKDLDIAAEIVGVESDDAGNRVVTVQLTESGAYAGKIELTAASADSENSMRITACKSYRAK